MTSLKLYVVLANSERQAIWARHATMLVANSLMVNVAHDAAKNGSGDALFLNVAGLALCLIWLVMICDGYRWFWKSMEEGKALPVSDPSLNPFARIQDISDWRKDWLFLCAVVVPVIFAAVYADGLGLWAAIKSLVCR
jgi:hypothetical protein